MIKNGLDSNFGTELIDNLSYTGVDTSISSSHVATIEVLGNHETCIDPINDLIILSKDDVGKATVNVYNANGNLLNSLEFPSTDSSKRTSTCVYYYNSFIYIMELSYREELNGKMSLFIRKITRYNTSTSGISSPTVIVSNNIELVNVSECLDNYQSYTAPYVIYSYSAVINNNLFIMARSYGYDTVTTKSEEACVIIMYNIDTNTIHTKKILKNYNILSLDRLYAYGDSVYSTIKTGTSKYNAEDDVTRIFKMDTSGTYTEISVPINIGCKGYNTASYVICTVIFVGARIYYCYYYSKFDSQVPVYIKCYDKNLQGIWELTIPESGTYISSGYDDDMIFNCIQFGYTYYSHTGCLVVDDQYVHFNHGTSIFILSKDFKKVLDVIPSPGSITGTKVGSILYLPKSNRYVCNSNYPTTSKTEIVIYKGSEIIQ